MLDGPKILIIHLNREINSNFDIKFDINEKINLKEIIYYKNNSYNYQLIGVVIQLLNGRFISFCKSFAENNWHKYDDSIINKSSFEDVKKTGFLVSLFYSLVEKV